MGGCFSGSQEPDPTKPPATQKDVKGAETKTHAAAVNVQSPSRQSASGPSGQIPLGRVSMSSEKAAGNQEFARHSRANSRTSIASLGDVTALPDCKTADQPLMRHSEPGNGRASAAASASNAAGVPIDRAAGKGLKVQKDDGWD